MNKHYKERRIDISIFHKKNKSQQCSQFINQQLYYHPVIKPIFVMLKHILREYDLHLYEQGGLKTYTLFLMILRIVEMNPEIRSIGNLLYTLCYYYGYQH